jgi:hypothetical protein
LTAYTALYVMQAKLFSLKGLFYFLR